MGNILAKQKAKDSGAYEAILYRDENHVTEGSSTNIFIVKDGKLSLIQKTIIFYMALRESTFSF